MVRSVVHPAPQPHGSITEILPSVFVVRGSYRFGPGMSIPRNMTIVRTGSDLTLINSVRLTQKGEAELTALGDIKHVVRLGYAHGLDDAYYSERFAVPLWGPNGMRHAEGLSDTRLLSVSSGPIPGADPFVFKHAKQPEACMLLKQSGGILVTCDSYQFWPNYQGSTWLGHLSLRVLGFSGDMIGPMWLKAVGDDVRQDFAELMTLEFQHILSGHGSPVINDGKAALGRAIRKCLS